MNRIILIGNGFDLAHGLRTGYKNFIDYYWDNKINIFLQAYNTRNQIMRNISPFNGDNYEDDDFIINQVPRIINISFNSQPDKYGYEKMIYYIKSINENLDRRIKFNNNLLENISIPSLNNWVDIEEIYYSELIKDIKNVNKDEYIKSVIKLHEEFSKIQNELEHYLTNIITEKPPKRNDIFYDHIYSDLLRKDFIDKYGNDEALENVLFINFNYTSTIQLYINNEQINTQLINIHGELNNDNNPIIFGYGDEIDDQYKSIEKINKNELFQNIKSIKYSKNTNYRNILKFLELHDDYQIFIFGHSCGLSDRTLLNTLFENEYCKSIKIFYYIDKNGDDNYLDTYMNITRNFNDKKKLRETVLPKELCVAYHDLSKC